MSLRAKPRRKKLIRPGPMLSAQRHPTSPSAESFERYWARVRTSVLSPEMGDGVGVLDP